MSVWNIHLLNARHDLTCVLSEIRQASREAVARASDHVDLPDFDLVVRARQDRSADGAVQGHAPAPGVIEIALTPDRFDAASFTRALVRQMAHLIRWTGPGYGKSLGEALVSEGLAGHFVLQVLGGQPDPCDSVRHAPGAMRQAMNEWARRDYDHARWFGGKGDLRKWTGNSLGHRVVAEHLAERTGDPAALLATAPAEPFRQILRRIAAAEGQADPEAAPSEEG
ncbi:DUF2268 domain-containing putative Zn-dependent protease [Paracoccus benzoatiresistens]|uniref:DUF2268 domain-containing putative Zn-dependent protease n=1 Tax=Paracoccus benzoatiresistens TaxID=2997341 RepID=A0ABT4J170_9RHOB|nr:DUF2268 domain-containing putative Zn-dependent protease [Paracoccus sp. EF6]MCZ0960161.1 DUF2268 domain-containing putative Zn-dependent protease [Paracoccus sp. EF6]